jgi:taurine dioxygenase
MHVEKLSAAHPGAIISGVEVRSATQGIVDRLKLELATHGVAVLRDQQFSPADYVAFAKLFGEIEPSTREQYWLPEQNEVYVISNVVENGRPIGNPNDGFAWHTDQYYFERPTAYTFLYCIETPPEGGETKFCGTARLYDEMGEADRRKYASMRILASHSKLNFGRLHEGQDEKYPDIAHPMVRTHPITGKKFIYFSSKLASLPFEQTGDEFDAMHADLIARATDSEHVYAHQWMPRDLVIWDNRGLLHTASAYDKQRYRRICHRISVVGEKPF